MGDRLTLETADRVVIHFADGPSHVTEHRMVLDFEVPGVGARCDRARIERRNGVDAVGAERWVSVNPNDHSTQAEWVKSIAFAAVRAYRERLPDEAEPPPRSDLGDALRRAFFDFADAEPEHAISEAWRLCGRSTRTMAANELARIVREQRAASDDAPKAYDDGWFYKLPRLGELLGFKEPESCHPSNIVGQAISTIERLRGPTVVDPSADMAENAAEMSSPEPSAHACETCGRSLSYYTNGGLQCPVCYKPEPDETPPQGWELCEVGTPADSWYCREVADSDGVFRGTTTEVRGTKVDAIAEARDLASAKPSVPDAPGWWWVKGVHGWQPVEVFSMTGGELLIEQAHGEDVRNGCLEVGYHEWGGRCLRGAPASDAATFDAVWAEWWGDRVGYYTANPDKWITDAERVCRHFFTEGGAPASDADRWAEEARDAGREARKASSQRDALIRAVEQTLHFRAEAYARDDGWSHICDGMNDRLRAALDMDPE